MANPIDQTQLIDFLNLMLESERAGAKVLATFLNRYERDSEIWSVLNRVRKDEAGNCKILSDQIRRHGGEPSHVTGDFYEKAIAIDDNNERLIFLNRGQGWVAKKLKGIIDDVNDAETKAVLQTMIDSHVDNIELCNQYIDQ